MYSKNDYRYYLENQLMHSDDFLAHYGVKGMKWSKVKKKLSYDSDSGIWTNTRGGFVNNKGRGIVATSAQNSNTGETAIGLTYVNANKKIKKNASYNKIGRLSTTDTGVTKTIALDTTTKKKRKKASQKNVVNMIKNTGRFTKEYGDAVSSLVKYYHERTIRGRTKDV